MGLWKAQQARLICPVNVDISEQTQARGSFLSRAPELWRNMSRVSASPPPFPPGMHLSVITHPYNHVPSRSLPARLCPRKCETRQPATLSSVFCNFFKVKIPILECFEEKASELSSRLKKMGWPSKGKWKLSSKSFLAGSEIWGDPES